jgi:hypothetical protein
MDAVADPQVEAALAGVDQALDALDGAGLVPVDGRDAYAVVRRLERIIGRVSALGADLFGEIERRGLHKEDGHGTARSMVRFAADLSSAEAGRRAKAARTLGAMPAVRDGLRSGRLGVCQVDRIARVHANPRVREQLEAVDADLAVVAERHPYDEFDRYLSRWELLADEDGAADRAERDHRRRNFTVHRNLDGSYRMQGGCGSLQGTVAADIFEAYVQAELEADWADARVRCGEAAGVDDLARTDAQRRMDAVERIFTDAASSLAERTGHQIVTDLVIDEVTFERTAARVAGHDPGADPRLATWWSDPASAAGTACCETLDGRLVDPTEVVAATLVGHIRRVVYGADGVVIDLGRRQRLFTGPSRLAALLGTATCYWPGCAVPVHRCETDHLQPWGAGGSTSPGNGAPACGKHNRFRNHGFTVRRDDDGRLHVHRPDGSEIT